MTRTWRAVGRKVIVQKLPAPKRIGLVHLPGTADLTHLVECRATVIAVGPRVTEDVLPGDVVLLEGTAQGYPWDEFAREDGNITLDVDGVLAVLSRPSNARARSKRGTVKRCR